MEQLDGLLVARINRLENNLILIFGGTGVVVAVILYLFGGMLLSVLRSLKSIQAGAERLAHGDVSQLVDSHSSDELRAGRRRGQQRRADPAEVHQGRSSTWPAPTMSMAASARRCVLASSPAPMATWRGT